MKKRTLLYPLALSLAAGLTLSGCAASPNEQGTTTPASSTASSTQSPAPGASAAQTEHNETDTMFAQMMLPHHEQAITMSEMMLDKGTSIDSTIRDLAMEIEAAQGPEIVKMNEWLSAWGEPVSPEMAGHSMDGMLSQDELGALETAEGAEASGLFLTQMIGHHKGAVQMAEDALTNGSNPQVLELASAVVKDQEAEIKTMEELLPQYS